MKKLNLKKLFNIWLLKIMIKCDAIQNQLLKIIKILHITITVIQNAKGRGYIRYSKNKKYQNEININTNENFIIAKSHT